MLSGRESITYSGVVTTMLDRETLTHMDEGTRRTLSTAADAYEQAPARLRTVILAAARAGEKPADIVRAIRHVYTYDYVARIVRQDRAANPGEYARES
jgi:hypothetical protein